MNKWHKYSPPAFARQLQRVETLNNLIHLNTETETVIRIRCIYHLGDTYSDYLTVSTAKRETEKTQNKLS